jgi:hypothetical protein
MLRPIDYGVYTLILLRPVWVLVLLIPLKIRTEVRIPYRYSKNFFYLSMNQLLPYT